MTFICSVPQLHSLTHIMCSDFFYVCGKLIILGGSVLGFTPSLLHILEFAEFLMDIC